MCSFQEVGLLMLNSLLSIMFSLSSFVSWKFTTFMRLISALCLLSRLVDFASSLTSSVLGFLLISLFLYLYFSYSQVRLSFFNKKFWASIDSFDLLSTFSKETCAIIEAIDD